MTNRDFQEELHSDLPLHEVNYTAREMFYKKFTPRANALVQRVLHDNLCEYPKGDTSPIGLWIRQQRWRQKLRAVRSNLYTYRHHALMLQRHFAIANDFKRLYETQALFDACGTAADYINRVLTEGEVL